LKNHGTKTDPENIFMQPGHAAVDLLALTVGKIGY
jgi:hypothetical protein